MRLLHRRFSLWLALTTTCALGLVAACSDDPRDPARLPDDGVLDGGRSRDTGRANDAPPPDPEDSGPSEGRVYAHTTDTLYLFEPLSRNLTLIGKFSCLNNGEVVIDIAVDRTGGMYATTFSRFLSVDPITATCNQIALGSYPNSLSFVPAGTVDPAKEALVGYAPAEGSVISDQYVRIDTTTGAMTRLGDLNTGSIIKYKSSGDIISLIQDGNKAYATVKYQLADAGPIDLLAEVDPEKGAIKRIIGSTNETDLFGFGYWAGKGYGFSDNGRIIEIDMTNGSSVVVKTLTVDGGIGAWYGAGVTTQAPVR
ncbi:MAG: hypothetical protein KF819_17465 [Labilithrix sp.]|nr:hypothetical protein [Labilithrix sp.]